MWWFQDHPKLMVFSSCQNMLKAFMSWELWFVLGGFSNSLQRALKKLVCFKTWTFVATHCDPLQHHDSWHKSFIGRWLSDGSCLVGWWFRLLCDWPLCSRGVVFVNIETSFFLSTPTLTQSGFLDRDCGFPWIEFSFVRNTWQSALNSGCSKKRKTSSHRYFPF